MKVGVDWALSAEKRRLDRRLAASAILLLGPAAIVATGAIKLGDRDHSPIFTQKRYGKDGELILINKLRTMPVGTPERKSTGYNDVSRTNRFAKFLSAIRLDEVPQLMSVFRGDMGIVGWRPLTIPEFTEMMDLSNAAEQRELQEAMATTIPGFVNDYALGVNSGVIESDSITKRQSIIEFSHTTSRRHDRQTLNYAVGVIAKLGVSEVTQIFEPRLSSGTV